MAYRRNKPDSVKQYLRNLLVAIDILLNCIAGGRVRTISERIGELKYHGKLKRFPIENFIDTYILEKLDVGHAIRVYKANQ